MATTVKGELYKGQQADKEAIILSLLTAQTNVMATIKRSALGRGVAKDHYQHCCTARQYFRWRVEKMNLLFTRVASFPAA